MFPSYILSLKKPVHQITPLFHPPFGVLTGISYEPSSDWSLFYWETIGK